MPTSRCVVHVKENSIDFGTVPGVECICFEYYSFYYNFNLILNGSMTQMIEQHS